MELENTPEVATQPTTVEARTFSPTSADADYADRLIQMESLLASNRTASPDVSNMLMGFNLSNPDRDAPNGPSTSGSEVADITDLASLLREILGQFIRHNNRGPDGEGGDQNGFHYAVNPKTGEIDLVPDIQTLDYRTDRDSPNDNGSHYAVDRNTGKIRLTPDTQTLDYRPFDRDAWTTKGSHHAVNPKTGRIELVPNIQLL